MIHRPDVLELFASQFWVADVAQLVHLGVSPRTIGRARQRGAVTAMLPGVVRLAGAANSFQAKAMAVQLHAGPHCFLSGPTAGALYGLRNMPRGRIEVTLPVAFRVCLPDWARLVRTSWVDPDLDVVEHPDGFRVARPLRMLWGLAGQFNQHRFERAAEDAWHRGLVRPDDATDYLAAVRRSGRTGVTRFENWLEQATLRPRPSQSGFELFFVDTILKAGLPDPVRQHPLTLLDGERIHIDLAWPDACLGIEPGHSWWHGGDLRMRKDMARDRGCDEIGWRVIRYDEEAQQDPVAVGRELVRIYRKRKDSLRAV